ncbi:MAG: amidohydrolase family protein, partial [Candidatus Bathyarchaeota archaeon]
MESDTYSEIKKHIDGIRVIDTHEHLPPEKERTTEEVDVLATFFQYYTSSDLISAGMPEEEFLKIWDTSRTLDERWEIFEPWWEKTRNTAYARALEIAARDLYSVEGISSDTYETLSKRMKERNERGLYAWVLKEMSKIDVSILDMTLYDVDRSLFAPVLEFNEMLRAMDRTAIETIGRAEGGPIHTLSDLCNATRAKFDRLQGAVVGVKIPTAYNRPIFFEKTAFSEAEEAFNEIYKTRLFKRIEVPPKGDKRVPADVGAERLLPLQDYLVHLIVQEAERRRLPIQIHTGLQEGNENIITHSKPTHLVNLFMEYKDAQFDIFHGGWPYSSELGALAKNFPNVYIDMCWMHVISESRARSALSEWLDEVPSNKIMGFGGDYAFVEGVYGHMVMAKENIARVLASKVDDGAFGLDDAKKYASWLLRDNPMRLFFPRG